MSKTEGYRTFWINANPDCRGWSEGKPDQWLIDLNPHGAIHVIEYRALEDLQSKLNLAIAALEFYADKDNFCLYDDIDWSDNWIAEREYNPQRLQKIGYAARITLKELKE